MEKLTQYRITKNNPWDKSYLKIKDIEFDGYCTTLSLSDKEYNQYLEFITEYKNRNESKEKLTFDMIYDFVNSFTYVSYGDNVDRKFDATTKEAAVYGFILELLKKK